MRKFRLMAGTTALMIFATPGILPSVARVNRRIRCDSSSLSGRRARPPFCGLGRKPQSTLPLKHGDGWRRWMIPLLPPPQARVIRPTIGAGIITPGSTELRAAIIL